MNLSPIQLFILYRQAVQDELDEKKEKFEIIKRQNETWARNLKALFENLQLFVNPKLFKEYMDLKDLDVQRDELNADNFDEEWAKAMEFMPAEFIVDEPEAAVSDLLPEADDELSEVIAGWVSRQYKRPDDGGE